MTASRKLRLGTRASPLARWQADWVAARLAEHGVEVELVPITTQGDQQARGPIASLGGQGVFTKEIQQALLDETIDLAVHSLKDLPTDAVEGLCLAAVPPRGPAGDVLVSREGKKFTQLPPGAVVGTGSLRRRAQLWHARPDLKMHDVRGNVDTRVQKLDEGQFDALVLAEAGLQRLKLASRITEVLPFSLILPAIGQGALAIEARADDDGACAAVAPLNDVLTHAAVTAERSLLAALHGGCLAPIGAWGRVEAHRLHLDAVVLSPDGRQKLSAAASAPPEQADEAGRAVAQDLLDQGAAELIERSRG
jgi:hydroxymethylbilane synthase